MAWVTGKSGTYNIYTKNSNICGYVKWQEQYDIDLNKSKVTQDAYLHRINVYSGQTWFESGTVTKNAYFGTESVSSTVVQGLSVAGSSSSGTNTSGGGAFTHVYSASKEITHDNDGTKSITLGFSMSNDVSGVAGESFTVKKTTTTVTLTTIPRASTISKVEGSLIGSEITVTISRASSNFKHQLWYKVGNSKWYDLGKGYDTSCKFVIDEATANQFPNSTIGNMQLCVRTFNGSTQIGSDYYKDVEVGIPPYNIEGSIKLTGNNLLSGVYVQGKSTVTVETTATTMYGATLSYSATVDGKKYTGNKFTSSVLSNGSKTVSVTITDSRGRTATLSSSAFEVYAYAIPSITKFTVVRQTDGTTVIATVEGSVAAVNNKNAKIITVTLNGVTQTITSSGYTINGTTTFTNVPTDNTLTANAKLTDNYTSATKDAVLPTVAVTMDFHHSGKGIAMGKVAETEGLFEIDWNAQFNKAVNIKRPALESLSITRTDSGNGAAIKFANQNGVLGYVGMSNNANGGLIRWTHDASSSYIVLDTGNTKDYIVEKGTSGVWTYRKWNSGLAECFGYHTVSGLNISTAWGGWYASSVITLPSFPFTFSGSPDVHVSWESDFSAIIDGVGKRESTKAGQVYLYRPVAQTNVNGRFGIYAYGKWK